MDLHEVVVANGPVRLGAREPDADRHDWYAPLQRQQRGAAPAGEQPMRIAIDRAFRENTDGTAKREADAGAGADRTA
jgi:hypothetical protein